MKSGANDVEQSFETKGKTETKDNKKVICSGTVRT